MNTIRNALVLALFVTAVPASAQFADDDPNFDTGAPAGAEENPDDPDALTNKSPDADEAATAKAEAPAEPGEYPQRWIDRPIILYKNMAEIRVEAPFSFEEPLLGVSLAARGRFAVSDDIEVGLRWSAIAFHESVPTGGGVDGTNTAGKAIELDVVYRVFDWLGAQVSVPFYVDPFAMGITLGAPMQGNIGPLRFFFGRDLVQIKVAKFVPYWDNPVVNEGLVAADNVNAVTSNGRVNILFGAAYQARDDFALIAEGGWVYEDFSNNDNPVPLWLSGIWSPSNKIDLGLQTGFGSLDQPTDSFGVRLFAGLRI